MKITVIGTGYVGLVTGACLAEMGNHVVCLDVDARKIALLNGGGIPIHEPGLEEVVRRNAGAKRLEFTTDVDRAVAHGTLQFIAVGTPPGEDGSADLQYVLAAARTIGERMTDYKVVIDKSTVPVGTGEKVRATIAAALAARGLELDFAIVSNPEFLKEGAAVPDFMRPDRVVIGADDERAILLMRALYAPYVRNRDRVMVMDIKSAEFTKYAANAMLATRISFMNDLSRVAEAVGADIELVRQGIGSDPRIGTHFLYAGAGYGGSCFPKDVKALIRSAGEAGHELQLLGAVEAVNERQKQVLADKVIARLGSQLAGKRLALWGLAFKPGTDDMREAPSRVLIDRLTALGAEIVAYDPVAMDEARKAMPGQAGLRYADSAVAAMEGADALVIVTEWKEFRTPDFETIRGTLRQPLVFDGRNLFEPALMAQFGIEYHCIGRPSVPSPA
ncbi:UDP-glucose/GDP-mannose dehydrogenase family protein [uncultured Methylibium sp.]|uniref:UDP-glucose dehydrogenase family protein n=1 Tax=uncultured Methylibium sp. TaxID=381093 RepID=UPI0025EB885C|nr:UDP-glucose/GDP-mannose dehydrogenase family protein [uncultured Methylibium sp.]